MTARLLLRILCTNTNLIFIISNSVPGANKISSMLLNDKVKVSWKTNCQWRDKPRWPKRKEIKLPQGEIGETSTMPLKTGDRVKIKFGSHWYDAEVAEDWQAKSKKG